MACIVYQTDKRTGIKYAYSSESYWDKDKKQPRSKRTFLGKVDPVTGKIIPKNSKEKTMPEVQPDTTGSRNDLEIEMLQNELAAKKALINELNQEIQQLTIRYDTAMKAIKKINKLISPLMED